MNYTLRKLKSEDMFALTTIISKIGYKEFKNCFTKPEFTSLINSNNTKSADIDAIGMNVALEALGIIIENLAKVKEDLYSFLASLSGMTKKDIAELDLPVFMQMIIDVIQKEEFADFFQVVSKFLH